MLSLTRIFGSQKQESTRKILKIRSNPFRAMLYNNAGITVLKGTKMETNILLVFDVDTEIITHRVREETTLLLREVEADSSEAKNIKEIDVEKVIVDSLRCSIETVIRKHLKDQKEDDVIKLVLSTTDIDPHFSNVGSTKCTVHHIPSSSEAHENKYLICGDSSLCKNVQSKIGSQASIFGTDLKS